MKKLKDKKIILVSAVIGAINGLFGGGGGMVAVPFFKNMLNMTEKEAQATAIAVILPITIVSATVQVIMCGYDFVVGLPTSIGVILGGVIGAYLLKKASNKKLETAFIVIMFLAGVKLLFF